MRKTRVWITVGCCVLAMAIAAWAQGHKKPGLWEMTTNMHWIQSPMPAGMVMPQGIKSPFSDMKMTRQVCVTQAMIDKYGTTVPQANGDCKMVNLEMKPNSMTAEMVCTGRINAKGTINASWTDENSTKGSMHFVGSMAAGPNPMPIDYTMDFISVYKGADCGSVAPLPMPKN
jgi:hypothetical protein